MLERFIDFIGARICVEKPRQSSTFHFPFEKCFIFFCHLFSRVFINDLARLPRLCSLEDLYAHFYL